MKQTQTYPALGMRYPSALLMALPMVVIGIMHRHVAGPMITLTHVERVSRLIYGHAKSCTRRISPSDIDTEMRLLERVLPNRLVACFERACGLKIWLAFHGQETRVCIGKKMSDEGVFSMHAWLEPDGFGRLDGFDVLLTEPGIAGKDDAPNAPSKSTLARF